MGVLSEEEGGDWIAVLSGAMKTRDRASNSSSLRGQV